MGDERAVVRTAPDVRFHAVVAIRFLARVRDMVRGSLTKVFVFYISNGGVMCYGGTSLDGSG